MYLDKDLIMAKHVEHITTKTEKNDHCQTELRWCIVGCLHFLTLFFHQVKKQQCWIGIVNIFAESRRD